MNTEICLWSAVSVCTPAAQDVQISTSLTAKTAHSVHPSRRYPLVSVRRAAKCRLPLSAGRLDRQDTERQRENEKGGGRKNTSCVPPVLRESCPDQRRCWPAEFADTSLSSSSRLLLISKSGAGERGARGGRGGFVSVRRCFLKGAAGGERCSGDRTSRAENTSLPHTALWQPLPCSDQL